jgi:hypothetical protein
MTGLELLQAYPKAANIIGEFYHGKLIASLEDDSNIPDDFKEMLKSQEFDNEYLAKFVDNNPRFLFDVFDANDIFIQTPLHWKAEEVTFSYTIERPGVDTVESSDTYPYRDIAEKIAVEEAIEYLNNQL